MKQISAILTQLLAIAKDVKVWFRILVLAAVGFAGAILFSRTKLKVKDCTFCEQQRAQLINALINVKQIAEVQPTVQAAAHASIVFIDTTPKQRIVNKYIDSVLKRVYMDSVKNSKN